jgi:hypothetical protein
MKTWAKVGIGCLAVLLVSCCIAGVVFIFAGAWVKSRVEKFAGTALGFGDNVQAMQQLDRKFSFTPPEGGALDEGRLRDYLSVCAHVKKTAAPYEAYAQAHQGEKKDLRDVPKLVEMTNQVTESMRQALEANRMSPSEFYWIRMALMEAEGGSGPNAQLYLRFRTEIRENDLGPFTGWALPGITVPGAH